MFNVLFFSDFFSRFLKHGGPKQLEVCRQSYLFPLCVLWKHVLSDELDKIVVILFCLSFTNISFSGQYLRFCCVLVSALLSGVDEAVFLQELVFGCSNRSFRICAMLLACFIWPTDYRWTDWTFWLERVWYLWKIDFKSVDCYLN